MKSSSSKNNDHGISHTKKNTQPFHRVVRKPLSSAKKYNSKIRKRAVKIRLECHGIIQSDFNVVILNRFWINYGVVWQLLPNY